MKYTDIPILMYHEISDSNHPWCVSPKDFQEQMLFLRKNGYRTISLSELKEGLEKNKEATEKKIVITFDDARLGVYRYAFSLLPRLGFTATIYVVPQWIAGVNLPLSESYSSFCTWVQLREMVQKGFEIGSHSYYHRDLTALEATNLAKELDATKQEIQTRLGCAVKHFSYPLGKYSSAVKEAVLLRYDTAVTTKKGFAKSRGEYARQWIVHHTSLEQFEKTLRRPKLSLCMVVKDEEQFIEQSLSSVYGLVDEIIVIDTGSTDRTVELAKVFTPQVYNFPWSDDFAAARNESLKYATCDWILVLDADEVLTKEDFALIQEAINQEEVSGYQLLTKNYTFDSSMSGWHPTSTRDDPLQKSLPGWFPSVKVRLFQKGEGNEFQGRVHEMVDDSIQRKGGVIAPLPVVVHHYNILREKDPLVKVKRNLELSKRKVADNPQNAKAYYELGIQYKQLGDLILAEEALQRSVELDSVPSTPWLNLALVQQKQGKFEEALFNFSFVLERNNLCAEAYFGLGFCYFQKGNLPKAAENFHLAVQCNPEFITAYINLGALCEKQGSYSEAIAYLKKALQLNPQQSRAYYNLGVVYEKQVNVPLAIENYEKAIQLNYVRKEELAVKVEKMKEFLKRNNSLYYERK